LAPPVWAAFFRRDCEQLSWQCGEILKEVCIVHPERRQSSRRQLVRPVATSKSAIRFILHRWYMSRVYFTCLLAGWQPLPAGICLLSQKPSSARPVSRQLVHIHCRHLTVLDHRLDSLAEILVSAAFHPCALLPEACSSLASLRSRCKKIGAARISQEHESAGYVFRRKCMYYLGAIIPFASHHRLALVSFVLRKSLKSMWCGPPDHPHPRTVHHGLAHRRFQLTQISPFSLESIARAHFPRLCHAMLECVF
jgi:hypothetical protein